MSLDLFQLLPAVYRLRDAQVAQAMLANAQPLLTPAQQAQLAGLQTQALTSPGSLNPEQQDLLDQLLTLASRGPLESLLLLVTEQLEALAYDLDQLYDDQFIETCAPWVIPYIGDLIGYQSVKGIAPAVDNPRAEVAETISLRRRKGTVLVIEQLARDVTGWGAHAVEQFQLLADTQYMKHIRPRTLYSPNLQSWKPGFYMDTAFDETAHKVDVRRINSTARQIGQYNLQNIAIFLWSLAASSITLSPLTPSTTNKSKFQLCYRFNNLGLDVPLFHRALSQGETISAAAGPANVPDRLLRRALCNDLNQSVSASFYGQGASLALYLDNQLLSPYQIAVADLSGDEGAWANLDYLANLPAGSVCLVAVDPELGRLLLAPSKSDAILTASWFYGVNADLGGGEYSRASTFAVTDPAFIVSFPSPAYATLQDALTYAVSLLPLNSAVAVEVSGGITAGLYPTVSNAHAIDTALTVDLPAGSTLELRSADLSVQTLLLSAPLTVTGDADSCFLLNGLILTAQPTFLPPATNPALFHVPVSRPNGSDNLLAQLSFTHATLVPGWSLAPDGVTLLDHSPGRPMPPLLQLASAALAFSATASILGGILANALATVTLTGSILDATDPSLVAYDVTAPASPTPHILGAATGGAALTLNACTVVGRVHSTLLSLVTNTIFWAFEPKGGPSGLVSDRKQHGCVRFSFLPFDAVTPPPYECVNQAIAAPQPLFASTRYGQPGYMKLLPCTDPSIRRGADDGSEMGVYHSLLAPQREDDLKIRLQEYLPVGLESGLIYQT
jgi:hypothetical protein